MKARFGTLLVLADGDSPGLHVGGKNVAAWGAYLLRKDCSTDRGQHIKSHRPNAVRLSNAYRASRLHSYAHPWHSIQP
jgi:hypothetical protein